ncbi:peptide chain release factor N(5)-glutamine methyltransferase [Sphingobium sp. H39-3-25]|uniref:peptide chain release factor N(5)-glutamine methyltransferase n=1 Tax=Sphingobium arseniciresistens TaxID=3030834 RepID=UPI0023B8DCFA|nr:peptide chain release factor N(5)-glutamine methyltransferase [Sphingobium arseniciresistens]
MGIAQALRDAAARLAPVSVTPRLDAELLLAHALDISREQLILRQRDLAVPPPFAALLERRLKGEPLAYIIGERDFWTLTLKVTPDVLIPRPDSETLIEAAIDHFGTSPGPARVLDLGTGSGALLLAALDHWRQARGLGIDASDGALAVARANAERLGLAPRADFRPGDWAEGIRDTFDLILINPPYISTAAMLPRDVLHYEPHGALFAGAEGLDDYRRLAPQVARLLAKGGLAAIEIGFDQGVSAAALFRGEGLDVTVRADLAGRDRCLMVTPGR